MYIDIIVKFDRNVKNVIDVLILPSRQFCTFTQRFSAQ